jgi:hypothetical protein
MPNQVATGVQQVAELVAALVHHVIDSRAVRLLGDGLGREFHLPGVQFSHPFRQPIR